MRLPVLLAVLPLAAACEGLVNPEDCRQGAGPDCEVYRPEGLLCGLVSRNLAGAKIGSLCEGLDPTNEEGGGAGCPDADPDDGRDVYLTGVVSEHEGTIIWQFCQATDNAAHSSGDIAEVPRGAACGLNSTHRVDTNWECLGVDPLREGGCPDGFDLHYALDVYNDCPESQPPVPDPPQCERPVDLPTVFKTDAGCADNLPKPSYGHLVVWCERSEEACTDCGYPDDYLCGLHGHLESSPADPLFWQRLRWEELNAAICETMKAEWSAQRTRPPTCLGVDPEQAGCPDGMIRACAEDDHGSSATAYRNMEALCWCTTGDLVAG